MDTTRRTFLGALGATAALSVAGTSIIATPQPVPAKTGPARPAGSTEKCLFWIAAATPCDKSLKFEEAAYRDMMSYFKENGADGIVVLGSTGEYPSFSVAERKKIAETALKHRNG